MNRPAAALLLFVLGAARAFGQSDPPSIFFSDLESGPRNGGEGGLGAFVTIRGKGFGAVPGSSTVTIGGGLAGSYRSWADDRIVFQLGPSAQTGSIVVATAAGASNLVPFAVRAGGIFFVSAVGDDGADGSLATPWRTIVKAKDTIGPGDIAYVMNGVSQTAEDNYGAALSIETSGTPGNPKALVAYPGATPTVGSTASDMMGLRVPNIGIAANDWVFAGFAFRGEVSAVELGGTGSSRWRFVNNDVSCPIGDGQTGCFAASQATFVSFLGNDVHDVGASTPTRPSKQYHSVYFTTDTNHVDVGWNHVHDNRTCRAIQFHSSPLCNPVCGPGDTTGFNQFDLRVHDNRIHGDACDGINFATVDPSKGPVEAYNNVIYAVGRGPDPPDGSSNYAGIYVPGTTNTGAAGTGEVRIFNNTLYDCGARGDSSSGAFARGAASPALVLRLANNVVRAVGSEAYLSTDSSPSLIAGTNNLWFGAGAGPAGLSQNVNADPLFTNTGAGDFHVQPISPAVDGGIAVSLATDHEGVPRPQGGGFDIGAYERRAPVVVPTIAVGDVSIGEGNVGSGLVAFTVTLSQPTSVGVQATYATADGTATAGSDYQTRSGVLVFAPGSTSQTVEVTVFGDRVYEPSETFLLDLSAPQNATLADGRGIATLTNDDPQGLSAADVSIVEPRTGTRALNFTVTLAPTSGGTVTVQYATANGTATSPADYATAAGVLTFPPNTATRPVTVSVNADSLLERREDFTLNLSNAAGASVAYGSAAANIFDPGSFHAVNPCRLIDTREPGQGPALVAASDRVVTAVGPCAIPATASAISANVTVTAPTAPGDLRLFPAGLLAPLASVINYSAGQTRANNAVLPLSASGQVAVRCDQASGVVHLIVDVNGYFE
jgi:hypothetical protein